MKNHHIALGVLTILLLACAKQFEFPMNGNSMYPTIKDGEAVNIYQTKADPEFLELVVIEYNYNDMNFNTVRRIIGLPGDQIEFRESSMYRNGASVDLKSLGIDFFFHDKRAPDFLVKKDITVPVDSYFVIGDNMTNAIDSRHFGTVEIDRIVARVREMQK